MASNKRLAVVFGASGLQGNSVVQSLLKDPHYTIRAVSRDITKPSIVKLAELGCELVSADYNDLESIENAVKQAAVIFAVTDFSASFSVETEIAQGKSIVAAASKVPTLERFIWSTLPDTKFISANKYQGILHCQGKPAVWHYIEAEHPSLFSRSTALLVQAYVDNWPKLPGIFGPIKDNAGFKLSLPISPSSLIKLSSPNDTGKAVLAILQHPEETRGKIVELFSEELSFAQMLNQWCEVLGKTAKFEKVTPRVYEAQNVAIYSPLFGVNLATKVVAGFCEHMCYYEDLAEKVGNWNTNYVQASKLLPPGTKLITWEEFVPVADWSSIIN